MVTNKGESVPGYHFKVEISATEMEAYFTVLCTDEGDDLETNEGPTVKQVIRYLEMSGVRYGILKETIESLIANQKYNETILIAKGSRPIPARNGFVKYHFLEESLPLSADSGKAKSPNELGVRPKLVKKDDLLAECLPPQQGEPGRTVTGKEISIPEGSDTYLRAGRNTYVAGPNQRELRASIDGAVSLQGDIVHVDGTLLIDHDITATAGQIDFPGKVVILRNVRDGVRLRAGQEIEVHGNVYDANLEADGDIHIRGEFKGTGRGSIYTKGNAHMLRLSDQCVKADGSVFIMNACHNARVSAGKSIRMTYFEGEAIGGHLQAGWNIIVQVVGDRKNTETLLELTEDLDFETRFAGMQYDIDVCHEERRALSSEIQTLYRYKLRQKKHDSDVALRLRTLQEKRQSLDARLDDLVAELKAFRGNYQRLGPPGTIQVLSVANPGTKIVIAGVEYEVQIGGRNLVFRKFGDVVKPQQPETAFASKYAVLSRVP